MIFKFFSVSVYLSQIKFRLCNGGLPQSWVIASKSYGKLNLKLQDSLAEDCDNGSLTNIVIPYP